MRKILKRNNLILFVVMIFCSSGLYSCWVPCAPAISGTVIDDVTGKPIDSVRIDFYEEDNFVETIYSDPSGKFFANTEAESHFIASKKCERNFSLSFFKDGYKNLNYDDVAPSMHIEIRLKK
ncbi:MAG: hypothetical protein K9J13_12020 [Saprospiraceae bacterium]|nr:hypothetical protein [Saprospiraceae bacterium]